MSTDLLHRPPLQSRPLTKHQSRPKLLRAADGFCADLLDRRAVCELLGGTKPIKCLDFISSDKGRKISATDPSWWF
jgi:hypothetical protein